MTRIPKPCLTCGASGPCEHHQNTTPELGAALGGLVEQHVRVGVEGHRRARVADHPLDERDGQAAGHQQTGVAVPEVVRVVAGAQLVERGDQAGLERHETASGGAALGAPRPTRSAQPQDRLPVAAPRALADVDARRREPLGLTEQGSLRLGLGRGPHLHQVGLATGGEPPTM